MNQIVLAIRGMHCGGCVQRLTKILGHQPNVAEAKLDFQAGRAVLSLTGEPDLAAYEAAIENAGFVYAGVVVAPDV